MTFSGRLTAKEQRRCGDRVGDPVPRRIGPTPNSSSLQTPASPPRSCAEHLLPYASLPKMLPHTVTEADTLRSRVCPERIFQRPRYSTWTLNPNLSPVP